MSRRKKPSAPQPDSRQQLAEVMLRLFDENKVAVVDMKDGDLKPYTFRQYVLLKWMEQQICIR